MKIDNEQQINNNNNLNQSNNINQSQNNIELITNEINEIFSEQQLIKKNNLIQKKDFFELEIIVLKDLIQSEKDISLLIIIPYTYPKSEPEIYCLTQFCKPHICDGRNLLLDIIKKKWQRKIHNLDFVVNKLPGFFISFNENRKRNKNAIVGTFILNKYYSNNRLKELPIYFHLITHKEKKSTFKTVKTPKIITISEISFCMFELDNTHTGYCKLIFFADLKDLISTKLDNKKNEIEIKWKNPENDKKNIRIEIISPNSENINKILLENKKEFLNYANNIDINKENNIDIKHKNSNNNSDDNKKENDKDLNNIISKKDSKDHNNDIITF